MACQAGWWLRLSDYRCGGRYPPVEALLGVRAQLRPLLDAIVRELPTPAVKPKRPVRTVVRKLALPTLKPPTEHKMEVKLTAPARKRGRPRKDDPAAVPVVIAPRRKRQPTPIVQFPAAPWPEARTFADFHRELDQQAKRHGDNNYVLQRALAAAGIKVNVSTIRNWWSGVRHPRTVRSMRAIVALEQRYRLPIGHLAGRLPHSARAIAGNNIHGITNAKHRRLAWYLPDDFTARPPKEPELQRMGNRLWRC